ncbi:MAG: plasmid partitioning protein RepB C-terminal domain-containing protein [Gemmataceae bacterium]
MTNRVRLACQQEVAEIAIEQIMPTRRLEDSIRKTAKFCCIEASIRELGLIEPLVVFPQSKSGTDFLLLDGHVRLLILKAAGVLTVKCLIASDDESFTFNHKVNRLSAIQEHFMILKATKSGVAEERIARSLNVNVASIRQKRSLLEGICPEAVQLLRDRRATGNALRELRKVKPMRQIEIAEVMCAASNYSVGYVKCLVAITPVDQLVDADRGKELNGISPDDLTRMEHEMESQARDFKMIEESYGKDVLNLVLVLGFLRKLVENTRINRYLNQRHPEFHGEFQKLVESRHLIEASQESS